MILKANITNLHNITNLALKLWPKHDFNDLIKEYQDIILNENNATFIYYINDKSIGFAQCGLRSDYVEGTESSPVGYLEGIFVNADDRKKGYASQLLLACEQWAKDMGCTEFASDCELDNIDSLKFHMAMGFDEANRIICFRKSI